MLLMGYSQIFTYVYLGAVSTPAARIADGIEEVHKPLNNSTIFDNAVIQEIEENKNERDQLNIHNKAYDNIASLFMPIGLVDQFNGHVHITKSHQHFALPGNDYIRLRVFRL